jgi:dynein heavy chain, axonemal
MKPRERPTTPDPNMRPKKLPDENKWIWEMIENIRNHFTDGIKPLYKYLEAFREFKEIL